MKTASNSYNLENGVLYVPDFQKQLDYFENQGFDGIKKIVFSDDIRKIPDGSFQLYKDLEEIAWPKALKDIGSGCFTNCISLRTLELPEELETIEEWAFQDAENVRKVGIPRSVRKIGACSFSFGDASQLLSIEVEKGNLCYCDVDGVLFSKDLTTLIKYPSARRRPTCFVRT